MNMKRTGLGAACRDRQSDSSRQSPRGRRRSPPTPKPDAAVKNKSMEANVFLDGKIKADPALSAYCLADGRKWLDKNAADAAKEMKQDPQFFKDGGWSFERKY